MSLMRHVAVVRHGALIPARGMNAVSCVQTQFDSLLLSISNLLDAYSLPVAPVVCLLSRHGVSYSRKLDYSMYEILIQERASV